MSWFGLVFVCFVVFCVSEVLGEAGCGFVLAGAFATSHNCGAFGGNRPPYMHPGLLSACCQTVITSSSLHMVNLMFRAFSRLSSVPSSFCPQSSFACFSSTFNLSWTSSSVKCHPASSTFATPWISLSTLTCTAPSLPPAYWVRIRIRIL